MTNSLREMPLPSTCYRALVVDDDVIVLRLAGDMLKILGYHVELAYGSKEALSIMEKRGWELVLTDLQMPYMDGFDLACRIRQRSKDTRIVIMTGCNPHDVQEKMQAGMVDSWIFKPLDFLLLKETIDGLFHNKNQ